MIFDQAPFANRGAERARQAPRLHVVRDQHHHFVARFDQAEGRDEVGFGAAVGHLDVVDTRAGIDARQWRPAARGCRWTASRPAADRAVPRVPPCLPRSSRAVSGRTPLSDRLKSTRFS